MISYEGMKPIEDFLLHPMCVLSHLMCVCKHCNIKFCLYYWNIEVADEFISSKIKNKFNAIFHNETYRQPGGPKSAFFQQNALFEHNRVVSFSVLEFAYLVVTLGLKQARRPEVALITVQ